MQRRTFFALGAALAAAPAMAPAADVGHVDYSPAAYAAALGSGKPLLLDFYAPW